MTNARLDALEVEGYAHAAGKAVVVGVREGARWAHSDPAREKRRPTFVRIRPSAGFLTSSPTFWRFLRRVSVQSISTRRKTRRQQQKGPACRCASSSVKCSFMLFPGCGLLAWDRCRVVRRRMEWVYDRDIQCMWSGPQPCWNVNVCRTIIAYWQADFGRARNASRQEELCGVIAEEIMSSAETRRCTT